MRCSRPGSLSRGRTRPRLLLELTTHRGTARFPSARVVLEADVRGWLPMVGIVLEEDTIEGVLAAAEPALAASITRTTSDGIEFDLSVHVVCATPT